MSEVANIPQLRFPEFSGEWVEKRGDEVFENISNKNHNSDLPILAITQEYGAIPRDLIDYKMLVSEKSVSSYKVVDIGDFIISLRSFQGGIEYSNYKGICSPAYIVLKPKTPIEDRFYKYFLKTYNYIQDLNRKLEGIRDGKMISYKYFSEINLPFPSLPEQQKIAAFLTAVDNRIELLGKKQALLKEYKKGLMQKIFTQEIRFKADGGSEFSDWEEKSLKTIFKERKLSATKADGYEHISLTTEGVVPKSERYERDFLVSDDNSKKYKVTKLDDICYNPANLKFGVISRNKYSDGIFSPIYVTFEVINADIKFIEYFVTRWDFINRVRKYEEGTVYERQAVKPEDFLKFSIPIPSIEEQTKIASFLSSIDKKI